MPIIYYRSPLNECFFSSFFKTFLYFQISKNSLQHKHSFKNDLDNYLPYLKFNRLDYCFVKDSFLYVLVEASCFFENEGNPPFPQLMEDSNPIVVKLKLKSG